MRNAQCAIRNTTHGAAKTADRPAPEVYDLSILCLLLGDCDRGVGVKIGAKERKRRDLVHNALVYMLEYAWICRALRAKVDLGWGWVSGEDGEER